MRRVGAAAHDAATCHTAKFEAHFAHLPERFKAPLFWQTPECSLQSAIASAPMCTDADSATTGLPVEAEEPESGQLVQHGGHVVFTCVAWERLRTTQQHATPQSLKRISRTFLNDSGPTFLADTRMQLSQARPLLRQRVQCDHQIASGSGGARECAARATWWACCFYMRRVGAAAHDAVTCHTVKFEAHFAHLSERFKAQFSGRHLRQCFADADSAATGVSFFCCSSPGWTCLHSCCRHTDTGMGTNSLGQSPESECMYRRTRPASLHQVLRLHVSGATLTRVRPFSASVFHHVWPRQQLEV